MSDSELHALLRTALDAGRMHAYDWDLVTDGVTRHGHLIAGLGETGAAFLECVHPDDGESFRAALAALRPEQPDFVREYRLVAGHRTYWVRDSGSGIFAADGTLVRVRGVVADFTPQREAEARLALIARVSELIGLVDDAAELLYEMSRAVGEHLSARRALFTELDHEHDRGIVRRDYCRGVASVAGVYKISDYAESTRREMEAGRIVVNRDAKLDPRTARDYEKTYEPNGERAYVAVPLLRDGRWVAEFWVSDNVPREWSEHEVALMQGVAERAWTAVEKLRVNAALRESEARMQFVSERAGVGYWYWDIARDEIFWSPVSRRLHDVPEGEPLTFARAVANVHPDDRATLDEAVRRALQPDGPAELEIEYRMAAADGTVRWIHAKGSVSFDGGVAVRMAGIALDATPRKTIELEREEASRTKDHFLALLSHELRTPMTTILGWATFIRTGMADAPTTQKGIESIEQASRTQARLIDDLLDVSRIVTGKMTLDRKLLDLTTIVRAAVDAIQPAARAASIALAADLGHGPAFVTGDATRLQQVIWNLLSNAVKFTPAGGEVHVALLHEPDAIELEVRDSGIGIEPHFLPHVFERFRQSDDGFNRRFGGLGLGLSIVRHLAELHGGTVAAASEGAGRGARFRVRLPRAYAASELPATRGGDVAIDHEALAGVRVLLVDDDPSAREIIGTMLAAFGARVTHAASVAEAVEKFESVQPDVLVSDIGMPDEDGYALIRRLRRSVSPDEARVPAIAVTAYADSRDRERALDAGYQAHLAKPVEPQQVAAAVLGVLPARAQKR
jgi:signal transduction histidine kinase/ActR/RegA family two-component response regulator